jgi:hypothetical protein
MLEMDFLRSYANGKLEKRYGGWLYDPEKYAKSLPYWRWDSWDGKIDSRSWILLPISVWLVSMGFYQIRRKEGWLALIPIFTLIGTVSVFALYRLSGGRYLQSVDWITIMFYSIGLVELVFINPTFTGYVETQKTDKTFLIGREKRKINHGGGLLVMVFLGIVGIGLSPVLLEYFLPNSYSESKLDDHISVLLSNEYPTISTQEKITIQRLIKNDGEVIYGQTLYPRYFPSSAELMTTNQTIFPSSLTLFIAGTELNYVVLPSSSEPDLLPHGSNILAIGCEEDSFPPDPGFTCLGCREDGFDALAVILLDLDDQIQRVYWRKGDLTDISGCPLTWPEE